ncbi:MAG: hypothetical protein JW789_00760 [Candidatus Aenigmarchaeota archaeon]|nr:hypothetical protein [Candidatus Aenigmarchaeota archaeon]
MVDAFSILGAMGLVLIIVGIALKSRKRRDILYIFGGTLLEIYSIYIGDIIFIVLQFIFTVVAVYDFIRIKKK